MTVTIEPFALQVDEGRRLEAPMGDTLIVKAETLNTNGSMTALEFLVAPKHGPALHTHLREDELWYVIEGVFRFKAGAAMLHASTGGLAFGPRGIPHGFQNIGDTAGRLLVIATPSGLERFFDQYAERLPGPVDEEAFGAIAADNWLKFAGPPVGVSDPL